ncbi:MAG: M23 family metallopeptidase [Desulfuromonadaceae bacterium]|nr:M23 family metallopeptidase [Desulfuromonadaceae bacterium]
MTKFLQISCLLAILTLMPVCKPHRKAMAAEWSVTIHPSILRTGDVARIELNPATAIFSATLLWRKQLIDLSPLPNGRLVALIGIPRDMAAGIHQGKLQITARSGLRRNHLVNLQIEEKNFPEQHLSLPPRQVSPDQKAIERHRREEAERDRVFNHLQQACLWKAPFQLPVQGKLLSPFGLQRILNGQPRSYHSGVDQRARLGEPVATAGGGLVVLVTNHFFAGKSVYIDHGMGVITMYFHLSRISISEGERVAAGQTIGLAGATGRASGPHLHWGARVHNCKVDPLALLRALESPP